MKFSELPVGATFVFEGERYCKVSPLMAHHAVTGASRLIHRSATVADGGGEASPEAQQILPETVASKLVLAALDELCAEVTKDAERLGADSQALAGRIELARQKFLHAIGLVS